MGLPRLITTARTHLTFCRFLTFVLRHTLFAFSSSLDILPFIPVPQVDRFVNVCLHSLFIRLVPFIHSLWLIYVHAFNIQFRCRSPRYRPEHTRFAILPDFTFTALWFGSTRRRMLLPVPTVNRVLLFWFHFSSAVLLVPCRIYQHLNSWFCDIPIPPFCIWTPDTPAVHRSLQPRLHCFHSVCGVTHTVTTTLPACSALRCDPHTALPHPPT